MRRNCDLELRLLPSSAAAMSPTDFNCRMMEEWSECLENQKQQQRQQQQQLTIFYNGRVSVWDVTELQARAIIWVASREMEDRMKTPTATGGRRGGRGGGSSSAPVSPTLQSQLCSPASSTGLSMKRSLQRFLHKRKNRILASSPYHY